ncbi:prepilin-type N-terminal cleavage/methylation domain-containing protein [Planctomycetes bacterium K23_9]|uniref:General secretion pathway GspH domain-containing protein n=1 Tax=Stieleria marina TaxID=1930275 RepID=A0A517NWD7_9BACT|nr:hypothetical protein K239x_34260 [Planctomycetes bacterium K23_9]
MNKKQLQRCRRGLSLLELLVVVTLMSIFASAAFMRFGRDVFGDTGARSESRTMSLALLQAQRAAIRSGDDHGLLTDGPASKITSWTVVQRRQDNSTVVIDGPHVIPDELSVSVSHNEMWFDFEGNGSQMFDVKLSGPHRKFQLRVEALTRMIRTFEVSP